MNLKQVDKLVPLAREYAKLFPYERQFRHISIIYTAKGLSAIGSNNEGTNPWNKKLGYKYDYAHSELVAFRKLDRSVVYNGTKLTLINFRFNRRLELRMSRPCRYCLPWCETMFDEIFYSTSSGVMEPL